MWEASEGAEGTGRLSALSLRVVCHRWLPAPTIGTKLSLVSSSKSQAVTSATSPVCPWVWPCQRSPPCCLETHGSLGAFGVGATGSPDGRFPRREGSSTPLLRFPLTGACCLPSAQGLGEAHLPPWFQVSRVPCPHLQGRMLPCEPGWGSPGSREHRGGLSPVTWAQLPTPAYQATEGTDSRFWGARIKESL